MLSLEERTVLARSSWYLITASEKISFADFEMAVIIVYCLLLLTVLTGSEGNPAANNDCPLWFIPDGNDSCKCGSDVGGVVKCNNVSRDVYLLGCFCMSHDPMGLVVGACPYHCYHRDKYGLHYLLPKNVSELEDFLCGHLNRRGRLCGRCKDGYVPSAYSYELKCVRCSSGHYNWVKYVAVALLPLTAFFIIMIVFQIRVTLPPMVALVHILQPNMAPQVTRIYTFALTTPALSSGLIPLHIFYTIYGVWNLDFFRSVIPPEEICLELTTVHALALDYLVALYPLLLILITYVLIELHARNVRLLIWAWKPVQYCFNRCGSRRQWNFKSSIIEAFAGFLLLSFGKMWGISYDLLVPVLLSNIHGDRVNKTYLFYDATVEMFSNSHLIFALISILVMVVFIFLPLLLLLLYPMRCFHKCLDCCGIRYHALMVFTDAFQGAYKNGTNGTRDHRWFALLYPSLRIFCYFIYALTFTSFAYAMITISLIGVVILIAVVQPYKLAAHNTIDTIFMLTLAVHTASIASLSLSIDRQYIQYQVALLLIVLSGILPLFYLLAIFLHWVYQRRMFSRMWRMCKKQKCCNMKQRRERRLELSESLPDRIAHPDQYVLLEESFGAVKQCEGQETLCSPQNETKL